MRLFGGGIQSSYEYGDDHRGCIDDRDECGGFVYGFVDHKPASFTTTRRFSFSCEMTNSAKSSACMTFSGLPSVSFRFIAISVAMVLGVSVKTRIFDFRTSSISDSDIPIKPNFEAL